MLLLAIWIADFGRSEVSGNRRLPWPAAKFKAALADAGVLTAFIVPGVLRFCTHHNVNADDVDRVLEGGRPLVLGQLLEGGGARRRGAS